MATLDKFKLTTLVWESDEKREEYFLWLESFGGCVRATAGGDHLEAILDAKLGRRTVNMSAVPSYILDDPDFGVGAPARSMAGRPS